MLFYFIYDLQNKNLGMQMGLPRSHDEGMNWTHIPELLSDSLGIMFYFFAGRWHPQEIDRLDNTLFTEQPRINDREKRKNIKFFSNILVCFFIIVICSSI